MRFAARGIGRKLALALSLVGAASAFASIPSGDKPLPGQYFVVLVRRPENAPQPTKQAEEKLQKAEAANLPNFSADKRLALSGEFAVDKPLRNLWIFKTGSPAEALELAANDPLVEAKQLAAEAHGPWLVDSGSLHERAGTEAREQYTLVLLWRDEKWDPNADGFEDTQKQHIRYADRLAARDKIAVAGRIAGGDSDLLRGLVIYRVGPQETATLVADDPLVKAGFVKSEVHPWTTEKGVLAPGLAAK
jgi:uncharacterized protein YciI